MTKIPLSNELVQTLHEYGNAARRERELKNTQGAEENFLAIWNLIPEPKLDHDHSQSIARILVEFYRDTMQIEKAFAWLPVLREAYPSNDPGTEFIAASVHYKAGDFDTAFRIFDELYQKFKQRPFQEKDPVYLKFYREESKKRSER
jgi:tetratricopeptide (TPR) repeat protein